MQPLTVPSAPLTPQYTLIYDGNCSFCHACLNWLRQRDSAGLITFLPFQHLTSPPWSAALLVASPQAVQLVTADGPTYAGGTAVLQALLLLNWHPQIVRIGLSSPFVSFVEAGYSLVARNRNHLGRFIPKA